MVVTLHDIAKVFNLGVGVGSPFRRMGETFFRSLAFLENTIHLVLDLAAFGCVLYFRFFFFVNF